MIALIAPYETAKECLGDLTISDMLAIGVWIGRADTHTHTNCCEEPDKQSAYFHVGILPIHIAI